MPTGVVKPRYADPFSPMLLSSPGNLAVTAEQKSLLKLVLDTACSDSKFAEKAYVAIGLILTGLPATVPVVTGLTPNSAEIGDPSFTLHVHGTGFKVGSIIVFAGVDEPTTHVSDTELTTGVNMSVWVGPDALPVLVKSPDGVLSEPQTFTFVDNVPAAMSTSKKSVMDKKLESPESVHPTAFGVKKDEVVKKDEKK